jgi:hypothetical protein
MQVKNRRRKLSFMALPNSIDRRVPAMILGHLPAGARSDGILLQNFG